MIKHKMFKEVEFNDIMCWLNSYDITIISITQAKNNDYNISYQGK